MKASVKDISTNKDSLTPNLTVIVHIDYYFYIEMPISISGILKTYDGKEIAALSEISIDRDTTMQLKDCNPDERAQIFRGKPNIYCVNLSMPLSFDAVEHIEREREKNPTKSVQFYFKFILKSLELREREPFPVVQVKKDEDQFDIPQSVWIHKYTEYLKIGKFLLLELPVPDTQKVPEQWVELYDRLYQRLEEMGKNIRKGNWYETMWDGRLFYEGLKFREDQHKDFIQSLKGLFMKDRHTEDGFEKFTKGVFYFFHYTSKFIHDRNKDGQLQSVPNATKEEAYFAYSLAIGLLNIIVSKLSK